MGPPEGAGNWEAIRAAQLLAKTPTESTAALLKALGQGTVDERWTAFALALCGTDDGVAWIRDRVRTEENSWGVRSFIYSLSLAGEKGKAAIADLAPDAKGNLQWAINAYHNDGLQIEIEFRKYPDIKGTPALPASVKR
jgi:hypothetical protein